MRNWFLVGMIVFLVFLGGTLFVPVPSGPGLPTTQQLLTPGDAFFLPGDATIIDVLNHLLTVFPSDVIVFIAVLFLGGLVTQVMYRTSSSSLSPMVNSPGWLLLGSLIWVFAAFEGGFVISGVSSTATVSPVVRHWLAGVIVQGILGTAVVLATVIVRSPEKLIADRFSLGQGFSLGSLEYLRAYPFLLVALIVNEWLVVQYVAPELPSSYRLLGAADSLLENSLLFLLVCLVAPVVEELFFRGIVYSGLRGFFSVIPAAVAGGILFSLVHFETQLILPLAVFGTILCLVYEWTGSVKVVITMHFLQNTVSFFMIKRLL